MSPPRSIPNLAISAHAGTGKTWRLIHRYLGLLAAGVPPDRIAAHTFSRKAAGEIFDRIVGHVCNAIASADERAHTSQTLQESGFPSLPDDAAALVRLLRQLVGQLHRLQIGTLDSFFLKIVRAFPIELGVSPDLSPMDEQAAEALALREAAFLELFAPSPPDDGRRRREAEALLRNFEAATYGQTRKTLHRALERFVEEYRAAFRDHPPPRYTWGDPNAIYGDRRPWWMEDFDADIDRWPDVADELLASLPHKQLASSLRRLIEQGLPHAPDRAWPISRSALFERLLPAADSAEPPELEYSRKTVRLPAELWRWTRAALARLVRVEFDRAIQRTRGLAELLGRYEEVYARRSREAGVMTFEDVARLLGSEPHLLTSQPDRPNRLYIDYRLDARLDHWLLDEFQDTSRAQWSALRNLLDEVIIDPARSLFYVGDIKQSIYGWRGGCPRLFGELLAAYAGAGERRIHHQTISRCHRSWPAVIETVNRVFDDLPAWTPSGGAAGPRRAAVESFAAAWTRHESEKRDEPGYAALLEYSAAGDTEASDPDEEAPDPVYAVMAELLRTIDPQNRGWEVAILVRRNHEGEQCAHVLRRLLPDVTIVHEGVGGLADHPLVTLLGSLVRYAAHPGDGIALRHLQMSPLANAVTDWDALPAILLRDIHVHGYARTLRRWADRIRVPLDDFARQRLDELLALAREFDARGRVDPDVFCAALATAQVRSPEAGAPVRIMTIHQAKGLGFDAVLLPFFDGHSPSFDHPADVPLLIGDRWVLALPQKDILPALGDAVQSAHERALADANFEQLCVLYVAMTRARRALYLILPPPPKKPTVSREVDLLRDRLAGASAAEGPAGSRILYETGDPDWHRRAPRAQPEEPTAPLRMPAVDWAPIIPRREPSLEEAESGEWPASALFDEETAIRRHIGSAVHAILEAIEWLDEIDLDELLADWRRRTSGPEAFLSEVEAHVRRALGSAAMREVLTRPGGALVEVWREAPFLHLSGEGADRRIVSGRWDRLVLERDAHGLPVRATVYDFKTNVIADDAELARAVAHYTPQMRDYMHAAVRTFGLEPARVSASLIFTHPGRVIPIPPCGHRA